MVDVESSLKIIYNLKMSCENLLRILFTSHPTRSTLILISICFELGVKVLGSRGWVPTVQCCLESVISVCYHRDDGMSTVVALICLWC